MTSGTTENRRKKLIQIIHIGKGKLGMNDEAYRAFLSGIVGKESCTEMTVRQLETTFRAMRQSGFVTYTKSRVSDIEHGKATLQQLE
jgi:phage gp16-like protein